MRLPGILMIAAVLIKQHTQKIFKFYQIQNNDLLLEENG